MKKLAGILVFITIIFGYGNLIAQENEEKEKKEGQLHGNFQLDLMSYGEDTIIGATEAAEKVLINSYANFTYTRGNFSAGIRYEGYLNTLQGYAEDSKKNDGIGFPFKYASYINHGLEITVGNFYDQYGNGLILRSYEDKLLGYDNAMQGIRVKYTPFKGLTIKGLVGQQRYYFVYSGMIRGIDAEISLNEAIKKFADKKLMVTIGGSFVSKYQEDNSPKYNYPENVGAGAGRININWGKLNFNAEYAYKINDPSEENHYIYKPGDAFLVSASYSTKGLGILFSAKRVDNMGFRTSRGEVGNMLMINNIPSTTRTHTYSLAAMYPSATQSTGEEAVSGEFMYQFKKGSLLGGKYGTQIAINFSRVTSIYKKALNDSTPIGTSYTLGYESDYISAGKDIYYEDYNLEITKKFHKKFKMKLNVLYQVSDRFINEGHGELGEKVYATIGIVDMTYKFKPKHALRMEIEHLYTKQDKRSWAMGLLEYSISPHWFFTVIDMWNYGNEDPDYRSHYYKGSIAYSRKSTRFQIGYGKQRAGILCVGGVCRAVPAANGFSLSITSTF